MSGMSHTSHTGNTSNNSNMTHRQEAEWFLGYPYPHDRFQKAVIHAILSLGDRAEDPGSHNGVESDSGSASLAAETNERGFKMMPLTKGSYGEKIQVHESSAAMHPHLWLRLQVPEDLNQAIRQGDAYDGEWHSAAAHLTVETAAELAQKILHAIDVHYHNDMPAYVDDAEPLNWEEGED